ncbi:MAG: RNB domain-containing ribonuclease [Sandaracinus sp.]|nr:RNB domain-containing ribonuclease [Sandaracinus sp.]MCB9617068.1 RNB domain-containing ribonuclease [Sandaracinus sp.]MCB9623495.1 RNB domain-containing ribonuclease [Sandaracinus sp.]MCB9632123.1 RNB domain-containing ribonuclease [Sandaracinus sp.]
MTGRAADACVCEIGEDGLAHPLLGGDPRILDAAPVAGTVVLCRDALVERVLAAPDSALARMHRLAARHGVSVAFPAAVEAEVAAWEAAPDLDDPELVDLESIAFVTIDGEGSRDLDQALHVARQGTGHRVLYALADAGHYVPPGSALFEEALARGASYYLPGISVPMLPRALSEGLVSLNPNVRRRAVLFDMRLDERGVCVHTEVYRVRIRSRAKLAWAQVQALYDEARSLGDDAIDESLHALREVGERRVALAEERGVLRYRRTELDLTLDGVGFAVHESPRLAVERYNEQLSLLTNVEGAKLLRDAGMRHVEGIYRVHPAPDPGRYAQFATMLVQLAHAHGLDPAKWTWRPSDAETLASFLDRLPIEGEEGRLARAIHRQAVLLNARSLFTTEPDRHFGVGAEVYARFSSPMREIVGVFLHRELLERLREKGGRDDGLRAAVVAAANRAKERQRALDDESLRQAIDSLVEQAPSEGFGGTVMGFNAAKVHVVLDAPPVDVKVYTVHLRRQLNAPLYLDGEGTVLRTEPGGDVVCRLGDAVRVWVEGRDAKRDRWIFGLERR